MLAGTSPQVSEWLVECDPTDPGAKFAACIPDATITYRKNGTIQTITLPEGIFWPDLKSNVLYVRWFFNDLWESVLNCCKHRENPMLDGGVLLGSPGST